VATSPRAIRAGTAWRSQAARRRGRLRRRSRRSRRRHQVRDLAPLPEGRGNDRRQPRRARRLRPGHGRRHRRRRHSQPHHERRGFALLSLLLGAPQLRELSRADRRDAVRPGVNGGGAAQKLLQRAINACTAHIPSRRLVVDGAIGPKTRTAMDAVLDHPGLGMPALAEAYREAARARYRAIARSDPSQRSSSRAGSPAPTSSGGTRDPCERPSDRRGAGDRPGDRAQ
jgi:hypothetical protein